MRRGGTLGVCGSYGEQCSYTRTGAEHGQTLSDRLRLARCGICLYWPRILGTGTTTMPGRSKQTELERVSRALRTQSGSNRALLRATDETTLLREICRVVVEEAGYCAVGVVRAEYDDGKTITPL